MTDPGGGFRLYRRFNDPACRTLAGQRHRLGHRVVDLFATDSLPDRLARALAARECVDIKDLTESAELFERTRRAVRRPDIAELCCGHGLTGLFFALLERCVQRVTFIDTRRPPAFDLALAAAIEVGPWVADKVRFIETPLRSARGTLAAGTGVITSHARGTDTDTCIDIAIAIGGPLAVMPGDDGAMVPDAPPALRPVLGPGLAADVHRTYRLTETGYEVRWASLPSAITPANRVLIGTRPDSCPSMYIDGR